MSWKHWEPRFPEELEALERRALAHIIDQNDALASLIIDLGVKIMALQDDVNADAAAIEAAVATLGTAVTAIEAEIAALQAANPAVDLSPLQTAVADLAPAVAAVAAVAPAA